MFLKFANIEINDTNIIIYDYSKLADKIHTYELIKKEFFINNIKGFNLISNSYYDINIMNSIYDFTTIITAKKFKLDYCINGNLRNSFDLYDMINFVKKYKLDIPVKNIEVETGLFFKKRKNYLIPQFLTNNYYEAFEIGEPEDFVIEGKFNYIINQGKLKIENK